MTNENIEITKEEVKENRFMKHLKKHKVAYTAFASSGVSVIGMTILTKGVGQDAYKVGFSRGAVAMHNAIWESLTDHVKNGVLSMELLNDTDDEVIVSCMTELKNKVNKED